MYKISIVLYITLHCTGHSCKLIQVILCIFKLHSVQYYSRYSRWHNVIQRVAGTSGANTKYQDYTSGVVVQCTIEDRVVGTQSQGILYSQLRHGIQLS